MLSPLRFLEYFAVIAYIGFGVWFIIRPQSLDMSKTSSMAIGTILVLYAMFRVYRIYDKYRKTNENE